jgi:hypothetical protein
MQMDKRSSVGLVRVIICPNTLKAYGQNPQAFEDKIKRAIRDAFAYDPLLTQSALIEYLNKKFNHSFDFRYIRRLTDKVMGQAKNEIDRATIEPRLTALRETYRVSREALLRILERAQHESGKSKPWDSSVIMAARSLVELDIAVLNAEVANGLYKNLDEAAAKLDYSAYNGTPLDVNSVSSIAQVLLTSAGAFLAAHGSYSLITGKPRPQSAC